MRVDRLAANIPVEFMSRLVYAEKRIKTFDDWSFNKPKMALNAAKEVLELYRDVWQMHAVRKSSASWHEAPIVFTESGYAEIAEAARLAVGSITELEDQPLVSLHGIEKATLVREMARADRVKNALVHTSDLVRAQIQASYVTVEPETWVKRFAPPAIGRVQAVRNCRVVFVTEHGGTSVDLLRTTVEIIERPTPAPLCIPGFNHLLEALNTRTEQECFFRTGTSSEYSQFYYAAGTFVASCLYAWYEGQTEGPWSKRFARFFEYPTVELKDAPPKWKELMSDQFRLMEAVGKDKHDPVSKGMASFWMEEHAPLMRTLLEHEDKLLDYLARYFAELIGKERGAVAYALGLEIDEEGMPDYAKVTIRGYEGRCVIVEVDGSEGRRTVKVDATDIAPSVSIAPVDLSYIPPRPKEDS